MAQPIIKIKRGGIAPEANTLQAGEFAIDQVAKNLYLGVEVGGVVTNEIVGGEGTFATKTYVSNAVTTATGNLGTMSTQDADGVAITGGAIDGTAIGATAPSTGKFTSIDMNDGQITNLPDPVNNNDAARKKYVDDKVLALGNAFQYVGTLDGGASEGQATPVASQDNNQPGDYYKVAVAGYFAYAPGGTAIYANVNDGIVVNSDHSLDIIDNTNTAVVGTDNEISVIGATDTGYTVAIDPVFSGRVSTAETEIDDLQTKTQNIVLAGTTAGTTKIDGGVVIDMVGPTIPLLLVGSVYGTGEADRLFYADGNTYTVEMGVPYGGEVKVRSTKFVGVNNSSGDMPAIENFIIDGGEY